ncbi:MAG: phosphate ABC transporter permease PstA [Pleurocapsa minor GSE-CHR-MK-17-07R]|jgi:phosphate transport system permease protein|nr:phosphate ABC transporter permease PstA [Pleurocapsa minor GSE-CHR-MK 17-07R]
MTDNTLDTQIDLVRDEGFYQTNLRSRKFRGNLWKNFFLLAIIVAFGALLALFYNIANSAFGYVVEDYAVNPTTLAPDGNLSALREDELIAILLEYQERRLPVYIRDYVFTGDPTQFTTLPVSEVLAGKWYPPETDALTIRDLTPAQQAEVLERNMDQAQMVTLITEQVVDPVVLESYTLVESIFNRPAIEAEFQEEFVEQGATLYFTSWVNLDFLTSPLSNNPAAAGARTAIIGTLLVVIVTICIAFPIGVGAAIYLEEYSDHQEGHFLTRMNRIIETNIRNLAGVPSIIYGLLGLAVFVRTLGGVTGGRTIISASLTMALLILPVIIINAQEALRAVPSSLRDASYGMGATKWQTIYKVVMPSAIPGILTGTILAMSRAIGETAPLIIVGASTFILFDPSSLQSRFTVLPILIYNWTSRPQPEFKNLAASAIIVLLVLLLILNATAIILRQRARKSLAS